MNENKQAVALKVRLAWSVAAPVLLVMAYLWGVVYTDTRLIEWGFRSYDQQLSPPELYIKAFWAGIGMVTYPLDWINSLSFATVMTTLASLFAVGVAGGLLTSSSRWKAWRQRKSAPAPLPERWRHVMGSGIGTVVAVAVWPVVLIMLSVVMFFALGPPFLVAKADAAREWENKEYEAWNRATWTTDAGDKRRVYVHSCVDGTCAILDEAGDAYVVARERVGDMQGKRPESRRKLNSNA